MIVLLNEEHVSQVAKIHKNNLPSLLALYSARFIEDFYKHHLAKKNDTIFIGFEQENVIVGFVFGTYDIKDMFGSFISKNKVCFFTETLKTLMKHPKYLLYILQNFFTKNDTSKDSETQLVYLAVDHHFEKKGIGKILLESFEKTVFKEKSYYELEVEQNNLALNFYKKNDFFVVREINNILEQKYLMGKNLK